MSTKTAGRWLERSDYLISGVLFSVSAILTLLLFYENAGKGVVYKVIFSTLAIAFDATKVVLWIRGTRERNAMFTFIALCLVMVSLLASSGSALMIVSQDDVRVASREGRLEDARASLEDAQKEVKAWQDRLAVVPADFTRQLEVVARQLKDSRQVLDQRQAEYDRLAGVEVIEADASATMFSLMGEATGVDQARLKLGFLLAVALLLEASALATSYHARPKATPAGDGNKRVLADTRGVAHMVVKGKALCGKPAPFGETSRQSTSCLVCMERSVKDA